MAPIPMTFNVEIPSREWYSHPLRKEWIDIPDTHPLYGHANSLILFLEQEYNINMINYTFIQPSHVRLEFKSEQDYTLWKLHQ